MKYIAASFLIVVTLFGFIALFGASVNTVHAASASPSFPYWASGGILSCTGYYCPDSLGGLPEGSPTATCDSICDLLHTGQNILYFALTILSFVILPIMTVWGGGLMMFDAGSSERMKHGRSIITNAIIGFLIAIGAFLIVNTFFWAISILTGGKMTSWGTIVCNPTTIPGTLLPSQCPDLTPPKYTTPTPNKTYACVTEEHLIENDIDTGKIVQKVSCTAHDDSKCDKVGGGVGVGGVAEGGCKGKCIQVSVVQCAQVISTQRFGCYVKTQQNGKDGYIPNCGGSCGDLNNCITEAALGGAIPRGCTVFPKELCDKQEFIPAGKESTPNGEIVNICRSAGLKKGDQFYKKLTSAPAPLCNGKPDFLPASSGTSFSQEVLKNCYQDIITCPEIPKLSP